MAYFSYFAYGSNMLLERLQVLDRCPSAQAIGPACAQGFELCFAKRSTRDGSGKATLVPQYGQLAYGVLFAIDESERARLNAAEGAGKHYDVVDGFQVQHLQNGSVKDVTTYLAASAYFDPNLRPYDWYRALVLAGATQHALPDHYLHALSNAEAIVDPAENRRTRVEAVGILRQAGFERLLP